MSKSKDSTFVSVVMVSDDLIKAKEAEVLFDIHRSLMIEFHDYEIIILDHNSSNNPNSQYNKRWATVLKNIDSVRVIKTTSHLERDLAYSIGIENAIGDCVVMFNPLLDPVDIISKAVYKNKSGVDVIIGVSQKTPSTIAYKLIRPLLGKLLLMVGYVIPRNSTGFYSLSRNAANSVTFSKGKRHKLFLRIVQSGLISDRIEYECKSPLNIKRKSIIKSIPETVSIMVFNSIKPLRFVAVIGAFASLFSLVFATYSFLIKIFNDRLVDGWASISVLISFQFMVLFIMLSLLAEYIGRILDENNISEQYLIIDELNSTVMINEQRINVLDQSK